MNEQKRKPVGILLTVILIAALLTICLELGLSYLRPDTPGSIPKHLIHFAIMFALLGGAVLLCLFCPPFKKLWAWIDEHILDKETRPIAIDIIYAVIAGLMLLHHFYVLLYYPVIPAGATKLAPLWILLAVSTILLGKSWQKISFRLSTFLVIFTFERLYIEKLSISGEIAVYFFSAIYALFICLGLFSAIRSSVWKPFLLVLCALWTLCTLATSIVGLYMAWAGISVKNLVGTAVYTELGRLSIFSGATITASILGSGSIMAITGFAISKNKLNKSIFLLACLIIMIANSLTDARASFISLAFIVAGTICISLWTFYYNQETIKPRRIKKPIIIILLAFCFAICFYCAVEGQRYLGIRFIETRNNGSLMISNANAEDLSIQNLSESDALPELPQFDQRDVWLSNNANIVMMLSYRSLVWQRVFGYIQKNPQVLLYGLTMDGLSIPKIIYDVHCHNILFQTLLEGGIPALFLYLSIIFYGIFHALRLWNHKFVPFWKRFLPIPVFSILIWEMAECLTHFSFGHPPMTLLWFFLGATITVSKSLEKAPKANEIPTTISVAKTGE